MKRRQRQRWMAIVALGTALALLLSIILVLERLSDIPAPVIDSIDTIVIEPRSRETLVLEAYLSIEQVPSVGAAVPVPASSSASQADDHGAQADESRHWRLSAPWPLGANAARIEPLLALLAPTGMSYTIDEIDLADAGLETPDFVVTFDTTSVLVGGPDHTGERRYVRHDERIYLVDDWLHSLLDGGVSAFAALEIFAAPLQSVHRVSDKRLLKVADVNQISARQIVAWPRPTPDPVRRKETFDIVTDREAYRLELIDTSQYAALHRPGTQFAWIADHTEIAALLER